MIRAYTADDMNRAIARVETAKQNHPIGWACIGEIGLRPVDVFVEYAFVNADLHAERLRGEDERVIYSAGWLNGLMIGAALGQDR